MTTDEHRRKAVLIGANYLGADLAQRESDESPCDVAELGLAITLLEAVPELIDAVHLLSNMGSASLKSDILPALRTHERKSFIAAIEKARAAVAKATGAP